MNSSVSEINVRFAERQDCPAIMGLKKELAAHQNTPDKPMLTYQELERDGFDRNPPCFHCIVAESVATDKETGEISKEVVGFALYFYAFATWEGKVIHLEDLCVTSKLRGSGIGKKLIRKLAQIGVEGNFGRIQLEALDWNESAIKFYESLGGINFTEKEGWHNFNIVGDAIKLLAQE